MVGLSIPQYKNFNWLTPNSFVSTKHGLLANSEDLKFEEFVFINAIKNRKLRFSYSINELEKKTCFTLIMRNLISYSEKNVFEIDNYLKLTYPQIKFDLCKHFTNQAELEKKLDEIVYLVASLLKDDFFEIWNGNSWDERFYENWR